MARASAPRPGPQQGMAGLGRRRGAGRDRPGGDRPGAGRSNGRHPATGASRLVRPSAARRSGRAVGPGFTPRPSAGTRRDPGSPGRASPRDRRPPGRRRFDATQVRARRGLRSLPPALQGRSIPRPYPGTRRAGRTPGADVRGPRLLGADPRSGARRPGGEVRAGADRDPRKDQMGGFPTPCELAGFRRGFRIAGPYRRPASRRRPGGDPSLRGSGVRHWTGRLYPGQRRLADSSASRDGQRRRRAARL